MNQLQNTNSPVILIADDDRDILSIIETILQEEGYQTLTASDGEQAVMLVQTHAVQLLILDIMMPKMNGDEASKCIRKINPSIPIVAMSAQSEYSIDQTIMNDSISKPIDEQKLNHILSKYVS